MKNELLIVVDMINGFVKEGEMADKYIGHIISANIELLEQFKKENQPIWFIRDCHKLGCKEFDTFPIHCVEETKESEIIDELKPYTEGANVYKKNSTCAMYAPNFMKDINKLKYLKRIIIIGCCTDICVMNLALTLKNYFDQIDQRTEIIIPMNVVETYNSETHSRDEYNKIAFQIMEQAGIQLVKEIR